MLNYIWLGLVLCAVLIGGWNDQLKEVADKSLSMAKDAVMDIALPLVGVMALWLGIMRLAERAGLVALLAGSAGRSEVPGPARQHEHSRFLVPERRRTSC